MTIYVDELRSYPQQAKNGGQRWFGNGKQSCHMLSSTGDLEELIAFAKRLNLKPEWIHGTGWTAHFDLTPSKRAQAIRLGAVEKTTREQFNERRELLRKQREEQELKG